MAQNDDPETGSALENRLQRRPTLERERIQSLDVLRGFALLGILLLNILGFGLVSAAYSNPGFDVSRDAPADLATWAIVELIAEGAMRALFSMLFGAGVVLFTEGRQGAFGLHYKRTFWLLCFGLFDAYVLLWLGDILVTYALAGAVLYWLRNVSAKWLLRLATVLLVGLSGFYGLMQFGLSQSRAAAEQVATAEAAGALDTLPESTMQWASGWSGFAPGFVPSAEQVEEELAARRGSYRSAARWNVGKVNEFIFFVIPVFMFWDALLLMLVGMALFKTGVLQGRRDPQFYRRLMVGGFLVGLLVNGFEVSRAIRTDLDLLAVFAQAQPTYHIGRMAMALGWLGLVIGWVLSGSSLASGISWLQRSLANVGRMALSNYLLHSVIALFLFTGAGLGLVGHLSRAALYPIVVAIWLAQIVLSNWWMARFRYGPAEWFWRLLTYGKRPSFRRN